MTDKPLEDMSEEEVSAFYYAHADTIEEHFTDGTVGLEPAASLGVGTSVRFTLDEHRAVRRAAEDSGVGVSAWIRQACADALARADDPGRHEL